VRASFYIDSTDSQQLSVGMPIDLIVYLKARQPWRSPTAPFAEGDKAFQCNSATIGVRGFWTVFR